MLGSSVLLECKVSGTPPMSVTWFQDGNEIVSGEKYEISFLDNVCALKLNALDVTDTGPYTCVATNVAGSDECSAFLTVQGQWKDIAAPSTKFFFPFLFLSSGFPLFPLLDWICLVLFFSQSFLFFFLDSNLLKDSSINIFLPLHIFAQSLEPPSFVKTPDPQEVLPGSSVAFTSYIKGTTPFKVTWFRGIRELMPDSNCSISLDESVSQLQLYNVEPEQSGDYACVVTNDAGSASCTTQLFVKGVFLCVCVQGITLLPATLTHLSL